MIQDKLGDTLYYFGYAKTDDNPTGFFEYETHNPEHLEKLYKFREDNEKSLNEVCSPDRQIKEYAHNEDPRHELLPDEYMSYATFPA